MSDLMDVDSIGQRGTKRKADDTLLAPQGPKRIKALDQDVVNKIAAGEIIVAPMHALKELIENAVDAGSTSLEIVVKDGGLKLLQITDNGHGINKDDLAILCERFTTSKLKSFEDLTSIGTYGFRGEALASISHIAHLTVTTKTVNSSCAWRAHYADGKLVPAKPGQSADPKPIAGRGGTQITVEDLFYNISSRQRAFNKSYSEEYAKILDVVGRYAIHCDAVAFSCKKHGDSGMSISVPTNASTVDRIRQLHGSAVANELIEFEAGDQKWGFRASGWTSNANYHVKKTTILLFINHRAVESSAMKAALVRTYSPFLPKGGHPFIYLSLDIDPQRVDVNVHPTKREVNFLNEDEIIESIMDTIRDRLSKVDTSRTFMTQSLLPSITRIPTTTQPSRSTKPISSSTTTPKPRNESTLVRTDPALRKITSMLPPTSTTTPLPSLTYTTSPRPPITCRLTTIRDLRASVRAAMHSTLTTTLATHTYVGLVDSHRRIAAIQSGTQLFLIDYALLANALFYQIGLTHFANLGTIAFDPPLALEPLIQLAVDAEQAHSPPPPAPGAPPPPHWPAIAPRVAALLVAKRAMLAEYFSLHVSAAGELAAIPLLAKQYAPALGKLPRFLMRLGPCVDWEDEARCFQGFLTELASFYAPERLPNPKGGGGAGVGMDGEMEVEAEGDDELQARREQMAWMLEHVLFPAFRTRLVATKGLLKGVVQVADLKGLYRVFERC